MDINVALNDILIEGQEEPSEGPSTCKTELDADSDDKNDESEDDDSGKI